MIRRGIDGSNTSNEESNNEININNNEMINYKGYFVEEAGEDEDEPKYYEHGAHFPYFFLYQKLEILLLEQNKNDDNINRDNSAISTENVIKTQRNVTNEKSNISLSYLKQNERSRNQNNNLNIPNKGKSVYPYHNLNIDKNPIDIKEDDIATTIMAPSNYAEKNLSSQYNTFGSKLKMNMNIKFYNNTKSKEHKASKRKPIQITSNVQKHTTFFKCNTQDIQSKSREFSASFQKNIPYFIHNRTLKENDDKKKISNNNKSLPKAFNNIVISYASKHNNNPTPGLEPQNTKIMKNHPLKKTFTKQSQTKSIIQVENEDNLRKKQDSISHEKIAKAIKSNKSPLNKTLQSLAFIDHHLNNSNNKRTKQITLPKNIENILNSNFIGLNSQSRNNQQDGNMLSKSKTNQSECESIATQSNIANNLLTQTKTLNYDMLKQTQPNLNLERKTFIPAKKTVKKNSETNKIKSYLDIKHNLNPKKANHVLTNKNQKVVGIKTFLSSNINLKDTIKSSNVKKSAKNQNIFIYTKKITNDDPKPNSPSQGSANFPGSTSTTTTHQLSSTTVPKNSSLTNLAQNECSEIINSDTQKKTKLKK